MGPPGPPRPRLPPPPPPLLLLPPPRWEVVLAAEEGGLLLGRLAESEDDMLRCVRARAGVFVCVDDGPGGLAELVEADSPRVGKGGDSRTGSDSFVKISSEVSQLMTLDRPSRALDHG